MSFDPADYPQALAELVAGDRRRPLGEGTPQAGAKAALQRLDLAAAFAGQRVEDPAMARCCLSGVWLVHDFLDESHTHSQAISTAEGSFWHGVMHRREGDFGNAKYWFRNVGDHPVYALLADRFGGWDPYDFVDDCESAVRGGAGLEECLDRQQAEWELLFDYCFRGAIA
ncbi:hypothetical protein Pla123a_35790 [Posidoniimonas polymericola]|uniref:Uncharacterized protein n=1 Tax=Posidoniimonas polymericola TaxID=2528002 RepID=A0A5C5YDA1_9BACT|nr:hypothetical protein [Posidoniimonas polymericola]TWT73686.1 hypothetical protein Pla123a_35790 [Posidoniimonas polymericola]